jgi:hypothetical protein
MRLGVVLVLHTFGSDLKWHPHPHLLITEGGLSLDGKRWVPPYGDGWLMADGRLKKMWRYHVIRALRRAHRAGELRFPEGVAFLADHSRFNALLNRLYQMTWYAHIGASLRNPGFTLRYIGRYTKRAVSPTPRSSGRLAPPLTSQAVRRLDHDHCENPGTHLCAAVANEARSCEGRLQFRLKQQDISEGPR